jgi:hypothetical protein
VHFVEPIHQSQTIPSTIYQFATRIITSARMQGWQQVAQHSGQVDLTITYTLIQQPTTKSFVGAVPMQILVQLFGPVRGVANFHAVLEKADRRLGLKYGRGQMVGDCHYGSATLTWRLRGQEAHQQQLSLRPMGQSSLSFQELSSS